MTIKYLRIQSENKFLLLEVPSGTSVSLNIPAPRGDSQWIALQGAFSDRKEIPFSSKTFNRRSTQRKHSVYEISIDESGSIIEAKGWADVYTPGQWLHPDVGFNGDVSQYLLAGARAFALDILPRSKNLADAAGLYRAGNRSGPYQSRADEYNACAAADKIYLDSLRSRKWINEDKNNHWLDSNFQRRRADN